MEVSLINTRCILKFKKQNKKNIIERCTGTYRSMVGISDCKECSTCYGKQEKCSTCYDIGWVSSRN